MRPNASHHAKVNPTLLSTFHNLNELNELVNLGGILPLVDQRKLIILEQTELEIIVTLFLKLWVIIITTVFVMNLGRG